MGKSSENTVVRTPHPESLLSHPSVLPIAPWCRYLENYELTLLLVTPPRGIGKAVTRGELAKRAEEVPDAFFGKPSLGDLYYQRVSRTVEDFEKWGLVSVRGGGRRRGYVLSPAGFVALMLNLRALRKDPVLEPAEFEMKREIVVATGLMLHALFAGSGTPAPARDVRSFFEEVDDVTVGGARVMSSELVEDTVSVLKLIERQRENVLHRKSELELAAESLQRDLSVLKGIDVEHPALARGASAERILNAAWRRVRVELPSLSVRTLRAGYLRHLAYLDDLVAIYAEHLAEVSLSTYRDAKGKR